MLIKSCLHRVQWYLHYTLVAWLHLTSAFLWWPFSLSNPSVVSKPFMTPISSHHWPPVNFYPDKMGVIRCCKINALNLPIWNKCLKLMHRTCISKHSFMYTWRSQFHIVGFCPLFRLWDFVLWDSVLWDFVLWDFVLCDSVPDSHLTQWIKQLKSVSEYVMCALVPWKFSLTYM